MTKRTGPTNIYIRKLISQLKKKSREENKKIWKYIAYLLSMPTRKRVEVNLWKIQKYASDGKIIIVPGKVLGYGILNKKVKVIAYKFSKSAEEKLRKNGIEYERLNDILNKKLDLKNVIILK